MEWREVVRAYLSAYQTEVLKSQEAKLVEHRAVFFEKHALSDVHLAFQEKNELRFRSLQDIVPESRWVVLLDSNERCVVEIPVDSSGAFSHVVPFVSTRIVLVQMGRTWKISAIYERCFSCNAKGGRKGGVCMFCNGLGKTILDDGERCPSCDGTGRCVRCRGNEMPGWRTASYL